MNSFIFDVDGTLWDSTAQVAEAWRKTAEEFGLETAPLSAERLRREFGRLMGDIVSSIYPELDEKTKERFMSVCLAVENRDLSASLPPLYEGVGGLFRSLHEKGCPIVIVSNCQAGYIELLTEGHHLEAFVAGHLCPADTGEAKAANIGTAIRRWHLENPCYVGDTMGDFEATRANGIPFIHASYGFGRVPSPDYRIGSPLDLLSLPLF